MPVRDTRATVRLLSADPTLMVTCHDVANYLLSKAQTEAGDGITNLKLQKLVYYAQGFHLAILGEPLFAEPIEAWQHGPVVPELYHAFKNNQSNVIPAPEDFDPSVIPGASAELLDEVFEVYGQFSAWKLRDLTHKEPTWKDAWEARMAGEAGLITPRAMRDFFRTQVATA